jgi:Ca-activated chloride channel family protein
MLTDWYNHIQFAYAWVFGFLLLLPIMILEYTIRNKKTQASMLVSTTHFVSDVRSAKTATRHLPFVLRCFALICLIIALSRPQKKFTEEQTKGDGIDIMLCFDISGSMTEKDFDPDRIDASKEVATEFVKNRPGDRIGIVIFSDLSFTLCPLTTDHNTVISQIAGIESGELQDEGTAIGSGLATSVDRLRGDTVTKSKIIILLTDGVDFGGAISPDIAKQMAQLYGIKIYAIGVGSEKEMDDVTNTPFGPMTEHRKLEFNEGLLKDLAQSTGGQYFHATDKDALKKIYQSINQLEKSKVEVTTYNRFSDRFFPWLVAGLAFLLIEILLRYTVFKKFP